MEKVGTYGENFSYLLLPHIISLGGRFFREKIVSMLCLIVQVFLFYGLQVSHCAVELLKEFGDGELLGYHSDRGLMGVFLSK